MQALAQSAPRRFVFCLDRSKGITKSDSPEIRKAALRAAAFILVSLVAIIRMSAATRSAACLALFSLVDSDASVIKGCTIEQLDGLISLFSCTHVDKTKALTASGLTIIDNGCRCNGASLLKKADQIVFGCLVGESPNI